jgi:hypothetical protein
VRVEYQTWDGKVVKLDHEPYWLKRDREERAQVRQVLTQMGVGAMAAAEQERLARKAEYMRTENIARILVHEA